MVSLAAVHRENGASDGCGIVALGGKWSLMGRIVPAGMLCAKGGKLELFAQKECYLKRTSSEGWTTKEKKISFSASQDCGFGTAAFNLELLNEEGNTQDVQTFDPSSPSLPGIGAPAL